MINVLATVVVFALIKWLFVHLFGEMRTWHNDNLLLQSEEAVYAELGPESSQELDDVVRAA